MPGASTTAGPGREDEGRYGVDHIMVNWDEQAKALRAHLGRVGLWVPGFATGGVRGAGELARRAEELGVERAVGGGRQLGCQGAG